MEYLIFQIIFCLLIAALIGFSVGWLLKSYSAKNYELVIKEQCEEKIQTLENKIANISTTKSKVSVGARNQTLSLDSDLAIDSELNMNIDTEMIEEAKKESSSGQNKQN